MFRPLALMIVPLSLGCEGIQIGDEGKPAFTSTGSVTVTTSTLVFPVMDHWQASLSAEQDLLAALGGDEVIFYQLQAGAAGAASADGEPEDALGVRLQADTWMELVNQPVALAVRDEEGDRNQASARIDSSYYASDEGTFTVTAYDGNHITGELETTLVPDGVPDGEPVTATFAGEISVGCQFLGEYEGGAASVTSAGLDDPTCAALFE